MLPLPDSLAKALEKSMQVFHKHGNPDQDGEYLPIAPCAFVILKCNAFLSIPELNHEHNVDEVVGKAICGKENGYNDAT